MAKISNNQIALKPQDLVVVLALLCRAGADKSETSANTYVNLGLMTGLAPSAVHGSLKRATLSRLVLFQNKRPVVLKAAVQEFLLHGAPYAFPPVWGTLTRGVPTAYAAAPLNTVIAPSSDPPPVWPYAQGSVRGLSLTPLYPTVPAASQTEPKLYVMLALFDAIRSGQAREREAARKFLIELLA
jgi:hypothetical protein